VRQNELLAFATTNLERLGIDYAIVGSMASTAWGEPRMTRDIDILVRLEQDKVESLCSVFPPDDFYVSIAAATDAVRRGGQFNVIHPTSGNKIDFMVARPGDWSSSQLARRRIVKVDNDIFAYVASPEDVILGKLVYYQDGGSEKHLRDIRGILKVTGNAIDRAYLADMSGRLSVGEIWSDLIDAAESDAN
jgi:hypothetical protein